MRTFVKIDNCFTAFRCIFLLAIFLIPFIIHSQSNWVELKIENGKVTVQSAPVEYNAASVKPAPQNFLSRTTGTITITYATTGATCQSGNGSLVALATGGTAPYTYRLNNGWEFRTGNIRGLGPGDYTLTVTDAAGETATVNFTITNTFTGPTYTQPNWTLASGCTANDATVTLHGSGGTPPYTYSIDGINYQTSNVFTGLYAGSYDFIVKDANGCTRTYNSFPMNLLLNCNTNTGIGVGYSLYACGNSGIIQASNTNMPYDYSLDGINYIPNLNFTGLAPGVHVIYYRHRVTGAVITFAVGMLQGCTIKIDYIAVEAACQQNDGTLTVTASRGVAPYTYTIDGINYQSGNVFTGLAPGDYFITVKDANGYIDSRLASVYDKCPQVSLAATGAGCAVNDGTITATPVKGTAPYTYSLDGINFQSSPLFTGLALGSYTVTIKDALGFTNTATISVSDACLNINATPTSSTCGAANGKITVAVSLGVWPYMYSLDGINFQSSNTFTGLAAASYTVYVRDNSGKFGSTTVTVADIAAPQVNIAPTPATCTSTGTATISGNGGLTPFQYSVDGNLFVTNNVFSLPAGNYTAWIRDANACVSSQTFNIGTNCPNVSVTVVNATCGNANGSIQASAVNGTAPYTFSVDGINFQGSNLFNSLLAGTYTVTVRDALGTTNTKTVTVQNICPVVIATTQDGICTAAGGTISVTGSNGTPPYQYSINNQPYQAGTSFTSLPDGNYNIWIRDANGLISSTTATVKNFPGPAIANASVTAAFCLNNNGTIILTASGGVIPLQYSIIPGTFQSNGVFQNLGQGQYAVTIKDGKNCIATQNLTVPLTDNLALQTSKTAVICEGKSLTLSATSNGNDFSWSPATGLSNAQALTPLASPITSTKYYLTATLGICSHKDSIEVTVNPAPVADAGAGTTICYGQDAQLNGSGGLTYNWRPGTYLTSSLISDPAVVKPLTTTRYWLAVKDINGCESLQESSVTVTVTPPAKVFAGRDTSIIMNKPFQLTAIDINNSGFTSYAWLPFYGMTSNTASTTTISIDRDMIYTVKAKTATGCEGEDEVKIKVYKGPEIHVPGGFSPNGDGNNDVLRAVPVGIKEFIRFSIFNRGGQLVFSTKDPANGWNGILSGSVQDSGVFVWIAEGMDESGNLIRRKGTVTLIR